MSQYNLGVIYSSNDYGLLLNLEKSKKWYIAATKTSHAKAQNNLGNIYREGLTVAKDYKIAVEMYKLAASQGYPPAQVNLGSMYLNWIWLRKKSYESI